VRGCAFVFVIKLMETKISKGSCSSSHRPCQQQKKQRCATSLFD
jgi:hypothetical protein